MDNSVIRLEKVTKDYGRGRGIFGIDLSVQQGEIYGYVGTNGSGKTTTLRSIMGFIRPDAGEVRVMGKDPWEHAPALMRDISYIPGEIEFPSFPTGIAFLEYQAGFSGKRDPGRMNMLIERMGLDPTADLRRMSKGMKQKTAIVAALMVEKPILILDEPTTGLDPLMRKEFLELLREEKSRGKTILMSTHIFEEVEEVCDQVSMIHDGRIISTESVAEILGEGAHQFTVIVDDPADLARLAERWGGEAGTSDACSCRIRVTKQLTGALLQELAGMSVRQIREEPMTLEQHFRALLSGGMR